MKKRKDMYLKCQSYGKSGERVAIMGQVALEKQRCARFWQDICSRAAARCFWMENRFPKGLSSGADDMAASGKL